MTGNPISDPRTIRTDLESFCYHGRGVPRARYMQPWIQNGYECAGDGAAVAIRATNRPDDVSNDAFDASAVIELVRNTNCERRFPTVPLPILCSACDGTGVTTTCMNCGGAGVDVCDECGAERTCEDCEGTGTYENYCAECVEGIRLYDDKGDPCGFRLPDIDAEISLYDAVKLSALKATYALGEHRSPKTGYTAKVLVWKTEQLAGIVCCLEEGHVVETGDGTTAAVQRATDSGTAEVAR